MNSLMVRLVMGKLIIRKIGVPEDRENTETNKSIHSPLTNYSFEILI